MTEVLRVQFSQPRSHATQYKLFNPTMKDCEEILDGMSHSTSRLRNRSDVISIRVKLSDSVSGLAIIQGVSYDQWRLEGVIVSYSG